ncbi:Protein CBG27694 [Caenorhabditis briggsae]|uniref:Protein CBG27694 n=1 Tax=Caenorhabditis briggsae TaxID=6238 RepID=B6IJD9_CAEBR|nr:Protein CBG27694 [Caenorhabditis briggsae]CAR99973.1 Protein CBG27694 [Caenorhabditis briggsae]
MKWIFCSAVFFIFSAEGKIAERTKK